MLSVGMFKTPHRRVTSIYLVVASLWILVSDALLFVLDIDEALLPGVNVLKGVLFVVVTSLVLYLYLRREFGIRFQLETDLREQVQHAQEAQHALENSEQRLRTAVEEAPLPMAIYTEDGEILTISRAWTELTGYDRHQLETVDAWTELAYGVGKDRVKSHIDMLFGLDARIDDGEFTINCADGSQRIWSFSSTPLGSLSDNRRAVISIAADVTERKQVEESARRSYNILQRIFDNSQFSLAYMDADFNFIQVNERYAQADNKSPEYFVGKNHFELYPNEENEAIFRHVVETGEPVTIYAKPFVYPLNPERGTTYWDWSLVPVHGDGENVEGLIFTLVDVTERVEAEQELRIKDSAIESSITPIALADLDGKLTYVNDAFLKLWKLEDRSQALGRSVLEFWTSAEAAQEVVSSLIQRNSYIGELQAQLVNGSVADVELTASLVRNADGSPICMMGSFNDVTKHKQAEQYALDNERLKARFQKEQEHNTLVQRIISALSHDMRTPLTVIATSADMLRHYYDRMSMEKREEKLDAIGRQVQFALELLDDTVNVARGNLADASFHPSPINVATLCQVSVDEIQAADDERHVLEFVNMNGTEIASVDEVLVSRILLNLLSNATKYSPAESKIRLELQQQDDWLKLRVIDYGKGISEIDLPHIFDPFYRSRDVSTISGTGLGLSIVKDCVQRHQGRIHVESEVGEGTAFTVELPSTA